MEVDNKFKESMGAKEASSIAGSASRLHGVELETWLREDIFGVINGFNGYDVYNMNIKRSFPGSNFVKVNGTILTSDVLVTHSADCPPACIIESKGTINENIYSLLYFAKEYKKLGIPFCVVTKDTKGVFKTGDTKYLPLIEECDNLTIYINNHNNYDNTKEIFNWEEYSWNDFIKPYHQFNTDLYEIVKKHYDKNNTANQFFDFNKENK